MPRVLSHEHLRVTGLNAEHTIFDVGRGADLSLGERVLLQPFYSDSTMCLHRKVHGVRAQPAGGAGGAPAWRVEREFDLTPSLGALH